MLDNSCSDTHRRHCEIIYFPWFWLSNTQRDGSYTCLQLCWHVHNVLLLTVSRNAIQLSLIIAYRGLLLSTLLRVFCRSIPFYRTSSLQLDQHVLECLTVFKYSLLWISNYFLFIIFKKCSPCTISLIMVIQSYKQWCICYLKKGVQNIFVPTFVIPFGRDCQSISLFLLLAATII